MILKTVHQNASVRPGLHAAMIYFGACSLGERGCAFGAEGLESFAGSVRSHRG